MRSTLFARPNLKAFLLAAVLIVSVRYLISPAEADDPNFFLESVSHATPGEAEMDRLIQHTIDNPTSSNYLLISDSYRKRGDTKKAMHYLRKAGLAASWED